MHCAHFSFDLLGPHNGFLDLTKCAHVHEFRKKLLTEFTVLIDHLLDFSMPPRQFMSQNSRRSQREGTKNLIQVFGGRN